MTGEEFRSRVGRRLGVKLCEATPCPMCHQMLDEYGAHAEGCMCGGDAVLRHNQNNFIMYKQAQTAGTNPERATREKKTCGYIVELWSGGGHRKKTE